MMKLERIHQGTQNIEEFITEFKLLVGQVGLEDKMTTNNIHLIGLF